MKHKLSPDIVTPENVERMLNDKSWVVISLDENKKIIPTSLQGAYPSPVDLCVNFEEEFSIEDPTKVKFFHSCKHDMKYYQDKCMKDKLFNSCIRKAKSVQKSTIRCIVSEKNWTKIQAFGITGAPAGSFNVGACEAKVVQMTSEMWWCLCIQMNSDTYILYFTSSQAP